MEIKINAARVWSTLTESQLSANEILAKQYLEEQRTSQKWSGKIIPKEAPVKAVYNNSAPLPAGLKASLSILRVGGIYTTNLSLANLSGMHIFGDKRLAERINKNLGVNWASFGGYSGVYRSCGESVISMIHQADAYLDIYMGSNGTVETPFGDMFFNENMGLLSRFTTNVANAIADHYQSLNPTLEDYKNRDITIPL